MRLYEYESKRILQAWGISVPQGSLLVSPPDASFNWTTVGLKEEVGEVGEVVLKAQVLTGGRQKAGGVLFARGPDAAREKAQQLFSAEIRGYRVEKLLMEEKVPVEKEYFLGVTYHTSRKVPLVIFSREGGVDVEEAFSRGPEEIFQRSFDILEGFPEYRARELLSEVGLRGEELVKLVGPLQRLVALFLEMDATLAEINPLARTRDGRYLALDCHLEIEDDALYRHPELESRYGILRQERGLRPPTELEIQAAAIDSMDHRGVAGRVVEFDGDLALLIGGGGASLTAFDAIRRHGGRPANYCEIGGNPSVHKVKELVKLLLSQPGVRKIAVIMNVVSNTRVDLVARGVIKGVLELGRDPAQTIAVFRIPGAWEDEGFRLLEKYGVPYCDRRVSIDEAARRAVASCQG